MSNINTKKAAMFGLDARIALAIFGALSVITGAALFKAIGDAKVVKMITELDELGKAYDAYYLDTGVELPMDKYNAYLKASELVESAKTGWNGPYTSLKKHSTATHVLQNANYDVHITEWLDADWTSENGDDTPDFNCVTGTIGGKCSAWVGVHGIPDDLYVGIDKKIDGSVDGKTGRVRHYTNSVSGTNYVFIKHRAKLN